MNSIAKKFLSSLLKMPICSRNSNRCIGTFDFLIFLHEKQAIAPEIKLSPVFLQVMSPLQHYSATCLKYCRTNYSEYSNTLTKKLLTLNQVKVNESQFIALFVVSGSIKRFS